MPILRIGNEQGDLCLDDWAEVFATMSFPRDEARRLQFLARVEARRAAFYEAGSVAKPRETNQSFRVDDSILMQVGENLGRRLAPIGGFESLALAPSHQELVGVIRDIGWAVSVVGDLMIYICEMAFAGLEASVNKSIDLELDFLSKARTMKGESFGSRLRYIKGQWSRFKPVCHLWAAYRMMQLDRPKSFEGPGLYPFWDNETGGPSFSLMLAYSEHFANFGCNYFPHSRREPILLPEEVWRVPPHVRLPPVDFLMAPLADWQWEALERKYKCRRPSVDSTKV